MSGEHGLAGPSPRKFTAASPTLPNSKHNRIKANDELIRLNMIKITELSSCQSLDRYDSVSLNVKGRQEPQMLELGGSYVILYPFENFFREKPPKIPK